MGNKNNPSIDAAFVEIAKNPRINTKFLNSEEVLLPDFK